MKKVNIILAGIIVYLLLHIAALTFLLMCQRQFIKPLYKCAILLNDWLNYRGCSVVFFCNRWQRIHDLYTIWEFCMSVMQEVAVEIITRKCWIGTSMYSKICLSRFHVHWNRKIVYLFRDIVTNNVMPCSLIEVINLFGGHIASILRTEVSLQMAAACYSITLLNFYQNAWHYISGDK